MAIRCRDCERVIPTAVVRSYVDGYPESMMRCQTCASWSETVAALEREIEAWKLASGLECGGDPDGVTPAEAQRYWEQIERERDEARAELEQARQAYQLAFANSMSVEKAEREELERLRARLAELESDDD